MQATTMLSTALLALAGIVLTPTAQAVDLNCTGTLDRVQVRSSVGKVFIGYKVGAAPSRLIAICDLITPGTNAVMPICEGHHRDLTAALLSRAQVQLVFTAADGLTCDTFPDFLNLVTSPGTNTPLKFVSVQAPTP